MIQIGKKYLFINDKNPADPDTNTVVTVLESEMGLTQAWRVKLQGENREGVVWTSELKEIS